MVLGIHIGVVRTGQHTNGVWRNDSHVHGKQAVGRPHNAVGEERQEWQHIEVARALVLLDLAHCLVSNTRCGT